MTKLTINPPGRGKGPTEEILDDALRVVNVPDANGRVIGIRRVEMSKRRRVFKILSADSQEKAQYLGMVMLAASVVTINGEDVRFPTSEAQFDALIDRLDDAGFDAIGPAYRENFRSDLEAAVEAKE